jgi:hypothetical protein
LTPSLKTFSVCAFATNNLDCCIPAEGANLHGKSCYTITNDIFFFSSFIQFLSPFLFLFLLNLKYLILNQIFVNIIFFSETSFWSNRNTFFTFENFWSAWGCMVAWRLRHWPCAKNKVITLPVCLLKMIISSSMESSFSSNKKQFFLEKETWSEWGAH